MPPEQPFHFDGARLSLLHTREPDHVPGFLRGRDKIQLGAGLSPTTVRRRS